VGRKMDWTEEEDKRLFTLFKKEGPHWSRLANAFSGRTDNQIKNRFYSTLRRVATKKRCTDPSVLPDRAQCKQELLKFVDDALEYGRTCWSKRGRKKKQVDVPAPLPLAEAAFKPFAEIAAKITGQTQTVTAESGNAGVVAQRFFPPQKYICPQSFYPPTWFQSAALSPSLKFTPSLSPSPCQSPISFPCPLPFPSHFPSLCPYACLGPDHYPLPSANPGPYSPSRTLPPLWTSLQSELSQGGQGPRPSETLYCVAQPMCARPPFALKQPQWPHTYSP
jgi:hypothetical protein